MTAAALDGTVVVDLTTGVNGAYAGKLLADLGEVRLSPFGQTGPYAGWRGSDIAVWAMGGYMYFTGSPDREPLWLAGSQAELHAGAHAAFAALVGLHERRRSGRGQTDDVSD